MEPFSNDMFLDVRDDLVGIFEIVFQDFIFAHTDSDVVPELLNKCPETPVPVTPSPTLPLPISSVYIPVVASSESIKVLNVRYFLFFGKLLKTL